MGNAAAISPKSKFAIKDMLVTLLEQTDLVSICEKLEVHGDLRMKFVHFYQCGDWIEQLVSSIDQVFPESADKKTTKHIPHVTAFDLQAKDTTTSVGTDGVHLLLLAISLRMFGRSEEMKCWLQIEEETTRPKPSLFIVTRAATSAKALLHHVSPLSSPNAKSVNSLSVLWRNSEDEEDEEEEDVLATTWDTDEEPPLTPTNAPAYTSVCYHPDSAPRELFLRRSVCSVHSARSRAKSVPPVVQPPVSVREQMIRDLCLQSIESWGGCAKKFDVDLGSARTATEDEDSLLTLLSRGPYWIDELARFLDEDLVVPISISRALTLLESTHQKCSTLSPVVFVNRAFERVAQVNRTSFYGHDLIQALQHEAYSERQGLDELHEAFLLGQAAQSTVTFARQKHSTAFTDQVTVLPVMQAATLQHYLTVASHRVLVSEVQGLDCVRAESAELVAHFVQALLT